MVVTPAVREWLTEYADAGVDEVVLMPGSSDTDPAGVVPRPGQTVTLEEIVAYLRDLRIAMFKLPERLELRDELPRNPLGKVLKRQLRDELRAARR